MPRHTASYADYDDYDDGYDDDYYGYDEYGDEGYGGGTGSATPQKGMGRGNTAQGSGMAQLIAAGSNKKKKKKKGGGAAADATAYPLVPTPAATAGGVTPFRFDTPSPDQAVLAAQSGISTAAGDAASAGSRQAGSSAVTPPSMAALSVADTTTAPPPPPRRPLSEYSDDTAVATAATRRSDKPGLHLVVVGHVDAGKSTLMGRLLHGMGEVSQKDAHKNAREAKALGKSSFAWAWALDQQPEERARGVTVDVAMARFSTPALSVTMLDAPGHRDFVPHMIAGAAQADAAVLVVDAATGGFEAGMAAPSGARGGGGQTREHAQLVRSLGIEQLVVAVNKMDCVQYDPSRFLEIQETLGVFLKGLGFKESAVQWVPVSGQQAENLWEAPTAAALAEWWPGPTLVGAVDKLTPPARLNALPLRLPVAEVVTHSLNRTLGAVAVGGKLEAGVLKAGTQVLIMPANTLAVVKGVEVDGATVAAACAGDSVDVGLSGVQAHELHRGSVLCHPDFPIRAVCVLEARVVALDLRIPILSGAQVVLYVHADQQAARVRRLVALLDSKTGEVSKLRPRAVGARQMALLELETLDRPLCVEAYADYKSLGRVTLRDGGVTLAVGVCTSVDCV